MQLMSDITDLELVRCYMSGNNEAFDALLSRHQDRLYNYILSVVHDPDIANDIFQDTFIKIITNLRQGRYTENGKFAAWLTRIAHNLIIDHFRQISIANSISSDSGEVDLLNRRELCDTNIEDWIVEDQTVADIRELIEALPHPQREVLTMRYYQNMSFKEIADITGVSINTALGRMRYAILNMRRIAENRGIVLSA